MRYSWCVLPAALLAGACVADIRPAALEIPARSTHVRVKPDGGGPVRRVPLEEYVRGAILSEFAPPSGELPLIERMLEVQAVVERNVEEGARLAVLLVGHRVEVHLDRLPQRLERHFDPLRHLSPYFLCVLCASVVIPSCSTN